MKNFKIVLLSILILFAIIVGIVFSIQGIDYVVHFKTYSQIDRFLGDMKNIRIKDKCYENTKAAAQAKSIELYDKAILSCTQYKNDVSALSVPQELSSDKQVLLKKVLKAKIINIDFILDNLNTMKMCNGDIKCLNKNHKAISPSDLKLLQAGNFAAMKVQQRLSVNYYFLLYNQKKVMEQRQKAEEDKASHEPLKAIHSHK